MSNAVSTLLIERLLTRHGWTKGEPGELASLWVKSADGHRYEMFVPRMLVEGGFEWTDIARRVAEASGLPAAAVETELAFGRFDVVRVRIPEVRRGSVPLAAGSTLVSATQGMLRAAATTARRPRHRIKTYSHRADEVVSGARLGHTEQGSMVFPVLLRLDEPQIELETPLDGADIATVSPESEQRRVTRTLAEALGAFSRTVVERAVDVREGALAPYIAAGGSREMMRHVQSVLREPGLGALDMSFNWAPVEEPRGSAIAAVDIPAAALDLVDRTVDVLSRPDVLPRAILTGPIISISHQTDGPILIGIQRAGLNGRSQTVELLLPNERRSQLHEWMNAGVTVTASGRIETRPGTTSRLLDADGPHPLEDVIAGLVAP